MAITIKSSARAWYDDNVAAAEKTHWVAPPLVENGSAIYAFLQDTGGSPRLRCYKANSYLAPSSFSEQDSSNAPTVTSATAPYCVVRSGSTVHVFVFTAATTVTHYTYNMSSDVWASGNGAVSTAISPKRNLFAGVRSDGDILLAFTSSADPADVGWARWEGASWTVNATAIVNNTSAEASHVLGAAMDSTDRFAVVFADCTADDCTYVTINSSNTVSSLADLNTSFGTGDQQYANGGRYNFFDASGTDTIMAAYGNISPNPRTRNISLEADASTGNLSTEQVADGAGGGAYFRSAYHTARFSGTDYVMYSDEASTGSIKYETRTAGTGAWGSITTLLTGFATGATSTAPTGMCVDLYPIGTGLAYVYQDSSNNVIFDWLVTPPLPGATGTISTGTHTVSGQSIGATSGVLATISTGTPSLQGQSIAGRWSHLGTISTQNLSVSGQSIAGRSGVLGSITTQNLAVSGQSIAGRSGVLAALSTANLVVSGQTILADVHLLAILSTQNYAVSGQTILASDVSGNVTGSIASGEPSLQGQSIVARWGTLATLSTANLAVSGQSIGGLLSVLGSLSTQNYSVSGQSIAGRWGTLATLSTGQPSLQGQSIAGRTGVLAVLSTGQPSLQGQSIAGRWGTLGTLSTQNYSVSGQSISSSASLAGIISTQNYSVSGQSIAGRWGTLAVLSTGTPLLQGQAITGNLGILGTISTGNLSVSGQSINAGTSFVGAITTGQYPVSGQAIAAIYGVVAILDTGILVVSANPILVDIGAFYEVDENYIVNVFLRPTVLHTINKYNSTVVGPRQREIKVGHE